MSKTAAAAILLCFASCALGETSAAQATSQPAETDRLAAESLVYHADRLSLLPDAPGRLTRARALLEFARRLDASSREVYRLLENVYRSSDSEQQADAALEAYLAACPGDYEKSQSWLRVKWNRMNSVEARIEFCKSVAEDRSRPAAVKADALVEMALRLHGRGDRAEAIEAVNRAIRLDPYNTEALGLKQRLEPTAGGDVELMLARLTVCPADASAAIALADMLQAKGLYKQAISFFEHAGNAAGPGDKHLSLEAAAGMCDAMLDAGQAEKAIEDFEPLRKANPDADELAFRLVEAHRILGQKDKADKLVAELISSYKSRQTTSPANLVKELAWFFLAVKLDDPRSALRCAQQAVQLAPMTDSPAGPAPEVLLAAAKLKSGNTAEGVQGLSRLAPGNIFAAAFLAEHLYSAGKQQEAGKVLLQGLSLGRGGWAYRRLKAMADQHKVQAPPLADAEPIRKLVESFDKDLLTAGLAPERLVSVRLEAVKDKVAPGEPVEIRATLTNKGDMRLAVGTQGLFVPRIALQVTAGAGKAAFADLPVARWPAGRYLMPGESISMQVCLDKGPLAQMLCRRPLDEIALTVSALLGPVEREDQKGKRTIASSLPAVTIQPVTITRLSLLSRLPPEKLNDMPSAYQESLGWIVYDMKKGQLPVRMRAARQVASLLEWSRQIEAREAPPPQALAGKVLRPVVLRMLEEVLKDSAPAVRAEMLAALCDVKLDADVLKCLTPVIDDSSPLVRLRVVELVGASDTSGKDTIVTYLAQDADELVRLMASAFTKAKQRP